jgi:hypothetical protein
MLLVHHLPDDHANHELALSSGIANSLHRKIQRRLLDLTQKSQPLTAAFDEHLAPLYRLLAVVEATAWRAVSTHAIDAELFARFVADELDWPHTDVARIITDAAKVSTALSAMTSVQREALLSNPLVALANTIAMDCETEFDNGDALVRWKATLAQTRQRPSEALDR